jgi:hypothetical protein
VWDNLVSSRLRLVFVADVIPQELRRIIEFLNGNFARTDVLGLEVRQYVGEGQQILVPTVVGLTVAAEEVKQIGGGHVASVKRRWTEEEFLSEAESSPAALELIREALTWAKQSGRGLAFGEGKRGPLYVGVRLASGQLAELLSVNSGGTPAIQYVGMAKGAPFDREEARLELNRRLNEIPGFAIRDESATGASWPKVPSQALTAPAARRQLFDALSWAASEMSDA